MRDDVRRVGLLQGVRGGLESCREIADFLSIRRDDVAPREDALGRAAGRRRCESWSSDESLPTGGRASSVTFGKIQMRFANCRIRCSFGKSALLSFALKVVVQV